MYNYNYTPKASSWRTFQHTLQRESKQNSRKNIKTLTKVVPNIKEQSLKRVSNPQINTSPLQQRLSITRFQTASIAPFNNSISSNSNKRRTLSLKGGKRPLKNSSTLKRLVLLVFIILGTSFTIQKAIPALVSNVPNMATKISTSFTEGVDTFFQQIASSIKTNSKNNNSVKVKTSEKESDYLSKSELKNILQPYNLLNLEDNILTVRAADPNLANSSVSSTTNKNGIDSTNQNSRNLTIRTTLDMQLQNFLLEQIESLSLLDRGKPEIIAMVAMDPHTGKILAMAGFDNHSPETNPCTDRVYPAASLFKMVTASAAVEAYGYSPATTMYFSGGKYTLYKRQLSDNTNSKYMNKVTLAEAFAQSINPVFGKLGSIILGKDVLEKYANSFGFNQEIDSELDVKAGNFTITENSYQWAEVASGFNRTTTISPIFGAMIASTMLNSGKTPVPCIVESVKDDSGKLLYKRKDEILNNTVKPDTAKAMVQMMNGTVVTGTARKSFRGADKDTVLSRLKMGGKTGSLSNSDRSVKFDWFSGFCTDTQEKQQIVVSVLVGHGKYIGTKASIYGRLMFKEYFNNYFALNPKQSNNG